MWTHIHTCTHMWAHTQSSLVRISRRESLFNEPWCTNTWRQDSENSQEAQLEDEHFPVSILNPAKEVRQRDSGHGPTGSPLFHLLSTHCWTIIPFRSCSALYSSGPMMVQSVLKMISSCHDSLNNMARQLLTWHSHLLSLTGNIQCMGECVWVLQCCRRDLSKSKSSDTQGSHPQACGGTDHCLRTWVWSLVALLLLYPCLESPSFPTPSIKITSLPASAGPNIHCQWPPQLQ